MKRILIEFKYPENPWVLYDYTVVKAWAKLQHDRMVLEHPGIQYRMRVVKK